MEKLGYLDIKMKLVYFGEKSPESNRNLLYSSFSQHRRFRHRLVSVTFYKYDCKLCCRSRAVLILLLVYFRGRDMLLAPCVKTYLINIFFIFGLSSVGGSCFISVNFNEMCWGILTCTVYKRFISTD